MTPLRLRYVQRFRDRYGQTRYYYRRGYFRATLPGEPGEREFMLAYEKAASRFSTQKPRILASPREGTFDALGVAYYRSAAFVSLSTASQRNYRRLFDRWLSEHGSKRVEHLTRRHVVEHLAARFEKAGPEGANGLRKLLKIACRFAVENGWRRDDPTLGIKKYKSPGKGFSPSSEEDIEQFLRFWGAGTREHTALHLLLYLGQRRGDTVRLGRQHRNGDRIRLTQSKTGTKLTIPIHADLKAVLDKLPNDNLTFLTTYYGKPFSAAGFGNWFREACDKAGLRHRSAHGLRKATARRLAEAGCSSKQIASITGHKTLSEVERYTASADQERMASEAISRLRPKKLTED